MCPQCQDGDSPRPREVMPATKELPCIKCGVETFRRVIHKEASDARVD